MNKDRRTRERIRLFFWAVLTVVCVVAALVARYQQQASLRQKVEAAQQKALRYAQNALVDRLDAQRVSLPIQRSGYDALLAQLKHDLFRDPRVARVRVWRPDGLLVFTTDDAKQIGRLTSDNEGLRAAFDGSVVSIVSQERFAPDISTTPQTTALLATYVPLRASEAARVHGVVEVDDYYGMLLDATTSPWRQMQIAFAVVAILCLVMTVLAFVWSRRPDEVTGFGPSTRSNKRELRAAARDTKKLEAARAEAAKLKTRVADLEASQKARASEDKEAAARAAELERLRARVIELEQRSAATEPSSPAAEPADPVELEALRQRAAELEGQRANAEGRLSQLQARVTEVEAQMRLTTDQLRIAQQRADAAEASLAEGGTGLGSAADVEERLTGELQRANEELERIRAEQVASAEEVAVLSQAHRNEMDQANAKTRISEEEKEQILAAAAAGTAVEPEVAPDAASRIHELEEALRRSDTERAMLRAGRPETVYEARNRELEDQLAQITTRLRAAEDRARAADASAAGVDPGVIAALEDRIAAAEARAEEAEGRLDELAGRRRGSKSRAASNGSRPPPPASEDGEVAASEEAPQIDGSEFRSRLVRSADARRRGSPSQTSDRY